jgi:hypothetical protein
MGLTAYKRINPSAVQNPVSGNVVTLPKLNEKTDKKAVPL